MKGSYLLCLYLSKDVNIKVGALGRRVFAEGFYLYVGSAMGFSNSSTLLNRVNRHLSISKNKKTHWHIDYLLNNKYVCITYIYLIPSILRLECILAKEINDLSDGNIHYFGSSDCNCESHLFYFRNFKGLNDTFLLNKIKN
jgi:Uri superfamily endonuclease